MLTGQQLHFAVDPCHLYKCHHGGTCTVDNGKAVCHCSADWMGVHCNEGNCLSIFNLICNI